MKKFNGRVAHFCGVYQLTLYSRGRKADGDEQVVQSQASPEDLYPEQ
jgi:hypothetical protein